jgi:tubulin polyglutamylase TTLL1
MVKNIKRFRREMEKENNPIADRDAEGNALYIDIVPTTYQLPSEYVVFAEEFKKAPNATWIMKPTSRSQGSGIFLVNKIKQVQKWASGFGRVPQVKEPYVISRYIDQPLLIGDRKFDLRIYVLVTNYKPLKVWFSTQGFARFCNEKYTHDTSHMENMMMHLTNVAVQKKSEEYNQEHGSKWSLDNLRFYLEQTRGVSATNKCFEDIKNVIYLALKSVQGVIINDRHCFELYGFDILIENNLKPWLIEVNASPSLSTTTEADRKLKMEVMEAVFNIVVPPEWFDENSRHGTNLNKEH